ncbi:hypothetical protein JX266_008129 [Neoarthrinium moseri]|nr:hypothetical protein JX266_008129 [Neoarthrinium moseri]
MSNSMESQSHTNLGSEEPCAAENTASGDANDDQAPSTKLPTSTKRSLSAQASMDQATPRETRSINERNQSSWAQAKEDYMKAARGMARAESEQRFDDAATFATDCWAARKSYSELHRFSAGEKLDMILHHTEILLQCSGLDKVHIAIGLDEVEHDARYLDASKWGQLCVNVGLLYLRWSAQQNLSKAKHYLELGLASSIRSKPSNHETLLAICQALLDVYDLNEDNGNVQNLITTIRRDISPEMVNQISIGEIAAVNKWCEDQGFSICQWYQPSSPADAPTQEPSIAHYHSRDPKKGISPLELALRDAHYDRFRAMLRFEQTTLPRATMSTIASNLLLLAADTRHTLFAQSLIDSGAKVNHVDEHCRSALHRCQHCPRLGNEGGTKLARLLVERDHSLLNQKDAQEKTALFMACEAGHIPMVQLLLDLGADPEIADIHRKTPLHAVCEQGDLATMQVLLNTVHASKIINKPGPGGYTPIIVATRVASANAKRIESVRELVRHNADPHIKDNRGNDAFIYATGHSGKAIKQILRRPGFESNRSSTSMSSTSQAAAISGKGEPENWTILSHSKSNASGNGKQRALVSSHGTNSVSSKFSAVFSHLGSSKRSTVPTEFSEETPAYASNSTETFLVRQTSGQRGRSEKQETILEVPEASQVPLQRLANLSLGAPSPGASTSGNEYLFDSETDLSEHEHESAQQSSAANSAPIRNYQQVPGVRGLYNEGPPGYIGHPVSFGGGGAAGSGFGNLPNYGGGSAAGFCNPSNFGGQGQSAGRTSQQSCIVDQAPVLSEPSSEKQFACPYNKAMPFAYPECSKRGFTRPRDIKQHLRRQHYKPYCSICHQTFEDPSHRDSHVDEHMTSGQRGIKHNLESMTDMQKEAISRNPPPQLNGDDREQWYHMFKILFPNLGRPHSPYLESDPLLMLDYLEQFSQNRRVQLDSTLQQMISSGAIQEPTITYVARLAIDQLFLHFRQVLSYETSRPSDSRQASLSSYLTGSTSPPLDFFASQPAPDFQVAFNWSGLGQPPGDRQQVNAPFGTPQQIHVPDQNTWYPSLSYPGGAPPATPPELESHGSISSDFHQGRDGSGHLR